MTEAIQKGASRHLAVALVALALAGACQGEAAGGSTKKAAAATAGKQAFSAGEVVIAPPSAPYSSGAVSAAGSVSGTVTLGSVPDARPAVETGAASSACGPTIPDESVQVQGGGVVGAVVWLDGIRTGKRLPLERRLELESDKCRLVPRVQAAVVGSAVNILGHDDIRQHLRFAAGGDSAPRATILLGQGEQVIPTDLPLKSPGMVAVSDTSHAWTRAWLAVFDHPYFAVTGSGGTFTIDSVPPGKYTLRAWHERTGVKSQPVEVTPNGAIKVAVELK